jgi:outer membrane protein assembly factor BamD (BamD/ComL family)
LYNAVYRQGVVVTMYLVQEDRKRSQAAAQRTQALAQELKEKYPKTDFAARGDSIAFKVAQGIPIYGNDRD